VAEQHAQATPAIPESSVLREQMVAELIEVGAISDLRIEAAFRAVPREVFYPPDTPAEQLYLIHDKVGTRLGADNATLPAPILHARNLAQLQVEPGMRVLEVGSGGPLTALLAHLVGPDGEVVAVDVDEGVTERTCASIEQLRLGDWVEVVTADAGLPLRRGLFDRIIATTGTDTIPDAWLEELVPGGILVVSVRLAPNSQRVIGFRHREDILVSESVVVVQGLDYYDEPEAVLVGPSGGRVTFQFDDDGNPDDFDVTDEALVAPAVEAWSGVTYMNGTEWVDLLTWVLVQPGGCQVTADDRTDLGPVTTLFPGITEGASYAILATRSVPGHDCTEIGVVAKGPDAGHLAGRLVEIVRTYDAQHRDGTPVYRWISGPVSVNAPPYITVLRRTHGALLITWPGEVREDEQARMLREQTAELRGIDSLLTMSLVPLLGERRPRGPLLPVTTEAHRAAAAQMARHFRREGGYDYSPYDPDDDASQPLLILSNYYGATFPVVAGAVGMTHDHDRWALAWVWIHPYERGFRGSGSAGLFSVVWDALEAQYGEFYVEGPYSAAMRAFMTRRGVDPSRYASGTFD
jgi:protein-L-isoaspartate(D-aspartate) O-methyltransferase